MDIIGQINNSIQKELACHYIELDPICKINWWNGKGYTCALYINSIKSVYFISLFLSLSIFILSFFVFLFVWPNILLDVAHSQASPMCFYYDELCIKILGNLFNMDKALIEIVVESICCIFIKRNHINLNA